MQRPKRERRRSLKGRESKKFTAKFNWDRLSFDTSSDKPSIKRRSVSDNKEVRENTGHRIDDPFVSDDDSTCMPFGLRTPPEILRSSQRERWRRAVTPMSNSESDTPTRNSTPTPSTRARSLSKGRLRFPETPSLVSDNDVSGDCEQSDNEARSDVEDEVGVLHSDVTIYYPWSSSPPRTRAMRQVSDNDAWGDLGQTDAKALSDIEEEVRSLHSDVTIYYPWSSSSPKPKATGSSVLPASISHNATSSKLPEFMPNALASSDEDEEDSMSYCDEDLLLSFAREESHDGDCNEVNSKKASRYITSLFDNQLEDPTILLEPRRDLQMLFQEAKSTSSIYRWEIYQHVQSAKRKSSSSYEIVTRAITMLNSTRIWQAAIQLSLFGDDEYCHAVFERSLTQFGNDLIDVVRTEDDEGLQRFLQANAMEQSTYDWQLEASIVEGIKRGCYLSWGYNDNGVVEWMYVGQSINLRARILAHYNSFQRGVGASSSLHCYYACKSQNVRFRILSELNEDACHRPTNDFESLLEALWCALLGTYNLSKDYLKARAFYGLPGTWTFVGVNANSCLQRPWRETSTVSSPQQRLDTALRSAWFRYQCALHESNRNEASITEETDLQNAKALLEKIAADRQNLHRQLLLSGQFKALLSKFTLGSREFWKCSAFEIYIPTALIDEILGDACASEVRNVEVVLKVVLHATATLLDLYQCVPYTDRIRYRGIQLYVGRVVTGEDQKWTALQLSKMPQGRRRHFPKKLLDILKAVMPEEYEQRMLELDNLPNPFVARQEDLIDLDDPLLVFDLINGLQRAGEQHQRNNRYICVLMGKDDKGTRKIKAILPRSLPVLEAELGLPKIPFPLRFLRANFDSDHALFDIHRLRDERERVELGRTGLDFLACNGQWLPYTTQIRRCGDTIKQALLAGRKIVQSQGGRVADFQETLMPLTEDVYDLIGEPRYFRVQSRLLQQRRDLFIVQILNHNGPQATFRISNSLIRLLSIGNVQGLPITIKIDAWPEKQMETPRLLVQVEGHWYDNSSIIPLTDGNMRYIEHCRRLNQL